MGSAVKYPNRRLLATLVLLCSTLGCSVARVENAQGTTETLENGAIMSKSNARLIPEPGRTRREAPDTAPSRQKRATVAFSSADMVEILQVHNDYRGQQCASDMTHMTWDDDLAEQSQAWADACVMEHGFDDRPAVNAKFSSLGQNLFMITGTTAPDNAYYIRLWYIEINYYTYATMGCQSGQMCGHYTQVVWSSTNKIGCGRKQCATLRDTIAGTTYNNADYVVCNYGPGGNVGGVYPFIMGTPCSACPSNSYWCYDDKLCRDCPGDGLGAGECTCTADCGCGTRDDTACTCSCQAGWMGGRCCTECADTHANCNAGWYPQNCPAAAFVPAFCPKMCSVCTTDGATCTLPAERRCDSSSGASTCPLTTAAPAPTQADMTTAAQPGSTTTAAAQGSTTTSSTTTTTAMQGSTTAPGATTTAKGASTTTVAQEVRDAQANAGVMFELQGSLDQWVSIWTNLQVILVDAINAACNLDSYYSQCCPNAGPKGSSYAAYVSRDTVLVADGYPVAGDTAGTINAIIYAEPLSNNQLCQPAVSRRRRDAQEVQGAPLLQELLYRVRRAVTLTFMPQEVLFVAVQSANSNISIALADCCNVIVGEITKSTAIPTTIPPDTTAFPGWAIAVLVIAIVGILAGIAGVMVYLKLKKPNKTMDVDSRFVAKKQIDSTSTTLLNAKVTHVQPLSPPPDVSNVD